MIIKQVQALKSLWTRPEFRQQPATTLSRSIIWSVRRRLGHQQWRTLPGSEHLKIAYPTTWTSWQCCVFTEQYPLDEVLVWLQSTLKPGMTVMDVGAHRGVWTMVMAEAIGPEGQIIAFEPTATTVDLLRSTVVKNGMARRTTIVNAAVGDHEGQVRIYHHGPHGGENSLAPSTEGTYDTVPMITLDDMLPIHGVNEINVIKIDVEGNEEMVIRGAMNTIRTHWPIVIFEATEIHAPKLGMAPDGAWNLLVDLGYELHLLDERSTLVRAETFGRPHEGQPHWNVIAIAPQMGPQ